MSVLHKKDELPLEFRAFDLELKVMRPVYQINFARREVHYTESYESVRSEKGYDWQDFKLCVLMLYTGLKDRHGNKIFVGDILNWDAQDHQPARTVVRAVAGGFVIDDVGTGGLWTNREAIQKTHSVVGNIYENEL